MDRRLQESPSSPLAGTHAALSPPQHPLRTPPVSPSRGHNTQNPSLAASLLPAILPPPNQVSTPSLWCEEQSPF